MALWKKIERGVVPSMPSLLLESDNCHFAYEYFPRQGHQAGAGNQLISDFKLDPTVPNFEERKRYKSRAAYQFADELAAFLPMQSTVCHVPTSKIRTDSAYDPRFDTVFRQLRNLRQDVRQESPFLLTRSHQSAHTGGERSVEEFHSQLHWAGLPEGVTVLHIVDDVITSGAHFKACEKMLRENTPGVAITGVFWAVTVVRADEATGMFPF